MLVTPSRHRSVPPSDIAASLRTDPDQIQITIAPHVRALPTTVGAPSCTTNRTVLGGGLTCVRRLVREIHAGSSYLSSEDPRADFGLGPATRVSELVVRRPDGTTTRRRDVAADRLVTVR